MYGSLQPVTNADSLIIKFAYLIDAAAWVLISLSVIFIVWNAFMFIKGAASEEDRAKYRAAILWGIVGLAVILSIWSLVAILRNTFGTSNLRDREQVRQDINSLIPRR